MEHLLFHWEDIVDLLVDEMIEDEVKERNQIEHMIMGKDCEETYLEEEVVEYKSHT